jgi:hypothetical protein
MMEAARTSATSADIQLTTRQYIPEDSELQGLKTVAMPPISKTLKPNITATCVVQGSCSVRHKVRAFIGSNSSTSSQPVYSVSTF